jgi:hypothetical protein
MVDLFDFNVQLYREALAEARRGPHGPQGSGGAFGSLPVWASKVEYSGTLHLVGGPTVGVVLESAAMDDVMGDGEELRLVVVPVFGSVAAATSEAASVDALITALRRRHCRSWLRRL